MSESISIPRPHVPYGPAGVPERIADADYLDHAARSLAGGYQIGGYNVTHTIIKLLHDTATALRESESSGLTIIPNPPMPPDEVLHQLRSDTERHTNDFTAGLRAIWRHGCDAGMVAGRRSSDSGSGGENRG